MEGQDREVVKTRRDSTSDDERVPGERRGSRMDRTRLRRPIVVFRSLVAVRDDEIGALLWAFIFLFSLLAGNYLIRPVRDDMGIAGGTAYLPALFAGTLVAMLVVWPWLSAWLGRQRGNPSCAPVFRGLQLNLVAFFVAFQLLPSPGQAWAARAFFVWASVSNLLVVSIAWGSLAGRFTSDQAHRLFGFIAAGGALGAISGSTLSGLLAMPMGPLSLMVPAAGFLELALLAARRLFPPLSRPEPEPNPPTEIDSTHHDERPTRSLYLVGLGLWTLLFTISSAFIYMEQARIVEGSIRNPAARTAFFARIDLLVNLLSLALQVSVTGWTLALLGAGGSAAILPAVTLVGSIVLALRPTVATVLWFQVARRAVDYAIARPSREVFYTAVGRDELMRVKGLIDTAVYRAGDAAGAWIYGLFAALPGLSGAAPLAVVPLSVFWFVLSLCLGRAMRRRLVHNEPRRS
jgi:AAA family ATP:ADP antiporter